MLPADIDIPEFANDDIKNSVVGEHVPTVAELEAMKTANSIEEIEKQQQAEIPKDISTDKCIVLPDNPCYIESKTITDDT